MTTRLTLVRHGESTSNVLGVATSALDGYPLTDRGWAQARALAESLTDLPARRIYASPVQRARETAQVLGRRLALPVVVAPGLEEIHVGEHEGRAGEDVVRLGTDNWERWLRLGDLEHGFAGGETAGRASERVTAALHHVAVDVGDGSAIVVSHGAALCLGLLRCCPELDPAFVLGHLLDNCARIDVVIDGGRWRCDAWTGVRLPLPAVVD